MIKQTSVGREADIACFGEIFHITSLLSRVVHCESSFRAFSPNLSCEQGKFTDTATLSLHFSSFTLNAQRGFTIFLSERHIERRSGSICVVKFRCSVIHRRPRMSAFRRLSVDDSFDTDKNIVRFVLWSM